MANAKKEFLVHTKNKELLCVSIFSLCASIFYEDLWDHQTSSIKYVLPIEHTQEEYDAFIKSLDFDYDSGYGGQELYGTIWYTNGTWSDRGEYDGSEWWQHHQCPDIPESLINIV
jgi:hypothetical protein